MIFCMHTVTPFNAIDIKLRCLTTMDLFVETTIHGFSYFKQKTNLNKHFVEILNSSIALPTKYMKKLKRTKMISKYNFGANKTIL